MLKVSAPADRAKIEYLISVVIPTYNYAHLLPRCLASVLGQLDADMELVVVDDGSQDATAEVLNEYCCRESRMVVVWQANAGAGAARNRGVGLARGRYILPLDADDELLPGALSALRAVVQAQPQVGLVLAGRVTQYADGRQREQMPTFDPQASVRQLACHYLLHKRISLVHGCSLFSRDVLLQRPYPQWMPHGEDIPVFAWALVSTSVTTLAQPVVRIYKHADSLRREFEVDEQLVYRRVEEVFAALPDNCQSLRRRYTAQVYLSLFRGAWRVRRDSDAQKFFWQALLLSPVQALRWVYLRKAVRMWLHMGQRERV